MDINAITDQFVKTVTENFLSSLTQQLRNQISFDISQQVQKIDVEQLVREQISQAVDTAVSTYKWPAGTPGHDDFVNQTVAVLAERTDQFLDKLVNYVQTSVINSVADKISVLDVDTLVKNEISREVAKYLGSIEFPENSIPGRSVHPDNLRVYANNLLPGLITKFESTGIQDGATQCQVTILDSATVFENTLVAKEINIAGRSVFGGEVEFSGSLPDSSPFLAKVVAQTKQQIEQQFNGGSFDLYVDRVVVRLRDEGIPIEQVRINGENLVADGVLSNQVLSSNLQKIGALRELQVVGETLLDETVYVSNGRLGVNTMEPERTLDLWDQEIQLVAGKRSRDTAMIGTIRPQNLVISSNNRENLTVNLDGSVSISQLNIGRSRHSSAVVQPTDNRSLGEIVWNERPTIGSPIGWVSLGGARWAQFGIITE